MLPHDPDSQFSKGALSKLEAAGIPVLTSQETVGKKLAGKEVRKLNIMDLRKLIELRARTCKLRTSTVYI